MKKLYQSWLIQYEKGIMGYSPMAIIGQSCLGAVAAMFILMNGNSMLQMTELFIVTIVCMFYNGAILAQQKPKVSFNILIISVLSSLFITILNLI
ncbi:hypothetical protein GTQ40_15705 [Flavobacteriaceae bacterium R38]|nr:hypothetical protein [Flavobacteriaceae bacterium R38]